LVVGLFLVYNTLSVSVAERRHDIGVLRAMGATRLQVASLFTGEALALGLIGSVLGVPLGWLMAWFSIGSVKSMLTDLFGVEMSTWPPINSGLILLALSCGMLTALLAALVPAVQASREQPADAVRRAPQSGGSLLRMIHASICALLILAGLACLPMQSYLPPKMGIYGAPVLMLVGLLVATPLLAGGAARLLQWPARLMFGVPERLAADNLARSPGRTGLVIAALAATVALMVQTAGVMKSSEETILNWLDHTIAADLFVTANSPVTKTGSSQPMRDKMMTDLKSFKVDGKEVVRDVVPVRFHLTDHANTKIYIVAIDSAKFIDHERIKDLLPGTELVPQLKQAHTAIVSENFAALHHVKVGDRLEFLGKTGKVPLEILGTMQDYTWTRGTVFMDRDRYVEYFGDRDIDVFNVYLQDGVDTETARKKISEKWGASESLVVLTRDETKEGVRSQVRKLYAFGYAQEFVVGIVAGLGVLSAMNISVLQRRRELGLLRAVGASKGQVLRTVLAEAALMGLVGAVLGLLFGIPLEWYMVRVLLLQEAGFALPFSMPWLAAGVVIGGALIGATLAGVAPTLNAIRLKIADAIAYE
jgi:putative ABC transport system permease protein